MKTKMKMFMGALALSSLLGLAACSGGNDAESSEHAHMDHSGSAEIPAGLKEAANPTFKVGDKAIIKEAHMEGMEGAEATIVGAYDTTAYAITYTPSSGGDIVEDHKWIIHEEIVDVSQAPLQPGTEIKVNADHMEGMDGVTATIDYAEQTTVYMIDFTSTDGEKVTNHKWVTEEELSPVK